MSGASGARPPLAASASVNSCLLFDIWFKVFSFTFCKERIQQLLIDKCYFCVSAVIISFGKNIKFIMEVHIPIVFFRLGLLFGR